jgi:hypothetical protein
MIFNEIKKAVQSALDFLRPIIDSKEPVTFKGTTAEWNALTPAEQAAYEVKYITDDVVADVIPVISEIDLGTTTINAGSFLGINLTTYGINTHNKPWLAFIYNRSNFRGSISLIGDGYDFLMICNNNTSDITGVLKLAILHSPA